MDKIFERNGIREIDRYTIENEPISSESLVERAAEQFTSALHDMIEHDSRSEYHGLFAEHFAVEGRIFVFAGHGANGADALAAARQLIDMGYNVFTILLNPYNKLSPECKAHKQRFLSDIGTRQFVEVVAGQEFEMPDFAPGDVIIDGIFGVGLDRPVEGGFAAIIDEINSSKDTVIISIDVPSGLFCDDNTNNPYEHVIVADLTFTFQFPKLALMFAENEHYVGRWIALPIGLHEAALLQTPSNYALIKEEDASAIIKEKERGLFTHKGDYGHALLVCGSVGKLGAAILAAKGCLRSGAGMLTVHTLQRVETPLLTVLPEAMVSTDDNPDFITQIPDLHIFDAIGIGPGIGKHDLTATVVEALLASGKPLVLDADALNIIADNSDMLYNLPQGSILTPHPVEFDRLAGKSASAYERLQKARNIATEQQVVVVLKGAYTAICLPCGNVYFNTTGNPGMATAGSGDVLTGIITGLLAQGHTPEKAAIAGVFMHGLAGDFAARILSMNNMISGDIATNLSKAFQRLI